MAEYWGEFTYADPFARPESLFARIARALRAWYQRMGAPPQYELVILTAQEWLDRNTETGDR